MPATRSNKQHAIDWPLCMFCQKSRGKAIRNVATMELSTKIINLLELDSIMHVRLTNISDLVASERKYHLGCWVQLRGKAKMHKSTCNTAQDIIYAVSEGSKLLALGLPFIKQHDPKNLLGYFMLLCIQLV